MEHTLTLTDEEWNIVVQLLEREARELPTIIHHTRMWHRSDVEDRLKTVVALHERMHQPVGETD